MRIHCLQHVAFETPGTILDWAALHGHEISYTYFFEKNCSLPSLTDFDLLLIMGGYMNVDEEEKFSWLKQEKRFIKDSIDAGKKLLGICLGSQLIASALHCAVYKGKEKEIGFFPVQFSEAALRNSVFDHFSSPYTLFHWHGDTFDLPENAGVIASTDVCKHQAYFIAPNILGLQFHIEMNETIIEQLLLHEGDELMEDGKYIQSVDEIRSGYGYLEKNKEDLFLLLDKFLQ
ncbi:MAG TPA: amidotransferase [Mucilaginibacter sp.]|jgi:GMP synthase (glutamine-hydrolysing)|nr:amidotransferase [Mucilaginibacter sp.]